MISIVVPLFNEENNILYLLDEVQANLKEKYKYEIILVNDSSTDNTLDVIKSIKNLNIKIISNSSNKGQSYSILRGIKLASFENILTIDGDGQNDPADIVKLVNFYLKNKNIKLVGGIRIKRKDSLKKIISSRIANFIRSRFLNDNCNDTGCSLKVFNKKIFLTLPYFDGIHRFLPALFRGFGHETAFIDVNHRKRKYGISKYGTFNRLFKGIRDMWHVYKILKKNNQSL